MHTALRVGVRKRKRGWHCEVRAGVDLVNWRSVTETPTEARARLPMAPPHFPWRLLNSMSSLRRFCWVKRELKG